MSDMYDLKDDKLHTLKKKITELRDELDPFVKNERFDIEECLRLSKKLDKCVIGYMNFSRIN